MVGEKYGDEGIRAAERGGPTVFRYIVEGGEKGAKVVNLYER